MEKVYYAINDDMAKAAHNANHFSEYTAGNAEKIYKSKADEVYELAASIAEKKPDLAEKAEAMAKKYSYKLANYYNAYYKNEASCPNILISGAGNFPVSKKEKQNNRREALFKEWNYLEEYKEKIKDMLTARQPILSSDKNALERLERKLEELEELQRRMKAVNAYYRKNKTLDGCPELTEEQIEILKTNIKEVAFQDKPFMSFQLTNNNAVIKNTKARIERLKKEKAAGTQETETKFFKIVQNKELMRMQLIFDGKPDSGTREILKSNGFKWSPKNGCWQRQLTNNARYSVKIIIGELNKMENAKTETC